MKVSELIQILQKMPRNAEVMYYDGDNGWTEPNPEYDTFPAYVYNPDTTETWTGVAL